MSEIVTYDQLRIQQCSSLEWYGTNSTQICFEKSCFSFKRDHIIYTVEITVKKDLKKINIQADTPTTFEKMYFYLGDVRRYEYLMDGAFYCMKKCEMNSVDITSILINVELSYFSSEKFKRKIPLELTDKEYKHYFLKWLTLQSSLGIINQVALFANCVNGITADIRIAMLAECFEALGKRLEKENKIEVIPEQNTIRKIRCRECQKENELSIRGKKTLKHPVPVPSKKI